MSRHFCPGDPCHRCERLISQAEDARDWAMSDSDADYLASIAEDRETRWREGSL